MHAMAAKPIPHRRARTIIDGIAEYKVDAELSKRHRIAHFLDWAARHYPRQYVPYPQLAKAVEGYKRTPQHKSREVEMVKSCLSGVSKILLTKYMRALDSEPGIGVRATVDDADTATVVLPKKVNRFKAAKNAMAATAQLVDPSNIPDTPEFKPWKAWLKTNVRDVLKMVNSPEFEQKLLPPANDEDPEEK